MFTADQIVAHLVGDYILQSHWMATEKTKRSIAAATHAITYTLPFLLLTRSPAALPRDDDQSFRAARRIKGDFCVRRRRRHALVELAHEERARRVARSRQERASERRLGNIQT